MEVVLATQPPVKPEGFDEFEERFKYVNWTQSDLERIENFAKDGCGDQITSYIEQRREQAMIQIGKLPPVVPIKVTESEVRPMTDAGDFLKEVGEIFNIAKKSKIANAFSGLGLAINCSSFFMSLLNPGTPDPTLELIKECFNVMMEKLEEISDQISDLEKLVEWGTVRTLLGPSEEAVRNALDKYIDLQNHMGTSYETAYYNDFIDFCEGVNLENCLRTLTAAFTDKDSAFGMRNLPAWGYEQTEHDYGVMQTIFTVVARLLLPGMHMQLFICKHKLLNIDYEQKEWAEKIDKVTENCDEQLVQIFDNLPSLVDDDFANFFRKRGFGKLDNTWSSYERISTETFNFFRLKYPFANFAVFSYTPMGGSYNHSIASVTTVNRIYLHQGDNEVNCYLSFEKKKQTEDWYIAWIRSEANQQALAKDIENVKNTLYNNRNGDAEQIRGKTPAAISNQRNLTGFVVPNRKVNYCNGVHRSNLVKYVLHSIASTENASNWNFAAHRYFGSGSW